MYYAISEGNKIPAGERLNWIKLQSNGVFVQCNEEDGHGVMIDGELYHVYGRPPIDKPTVDLVWQDDVIALKEENELLKGCIMELAEVLFNE